MKAPFIEISHDHGLRLWEINIVADDEVNFCQVLVHIGGRIEFRSKDDIEALQSQMISGAALERIRLESSIAIPPPADAPAP